MTRRRSVRKPRRVQVQFWRRGESQASPGYTTNISTTGMFLATTSPQPPGTRLRIEVMDGHHGFMVEGLVAHARKVRGDMMRITHPGMGIRFLSVTELVRELIPVLPGETEEIPEEERMWGEEGSPSMAKPGSATSAMKPPEPVRPVAAASAPPASPSVSPPVSPSIGRPVTAGVRASGTYPKPVEAAGAFTVQFLGPAEFVQVFERDIVNGGLFVSTRYPGRLQEVINVEILSTTIPVYALAVSILLGYERGSLKTLLGVLLSAAGVVYLINPLHADLTRQTTTGNVLILINSFLYALYLVASKDLVERYGALNVVTWIFLVGSLITVPVGIYSLQRENLGAISGSVWLAVAFIIIFGCSGVKRFSTSGERIIPPRAKTVVTDFWKVTLYGWSRRCIVLSVAFGFLQLCSLH